ncbi:MAG: DNA integrity scanning protein DisA nucleotide-binding domain protein [Planctomycetota bacterium]|jgi:DNA integrity scanning protein DisA with diadenylate cyclase activity
MTKDDPNFSEPMTRAAVDVAKSVGARVLFAYTSAVEDLAALQKSLTKPTRLILVCRDERDIARAEETSADMLTVPAFELTRMGQIKMATLLAFSRSLLQAGDVFVFLTGVIGRDIDTLVTMRVGDEYELFQSVGQPKLTEHIRPTVFQRVLTLALELAHEGREGKPVGALFVIGDYREVKKYCVEGRINPFKGYTEKQRNIIDNSMKESVKELSKIDGAFVIKGNGVIVSAGTTLRPALAGETLGQGLGSRHATAAAITANTKSISISLSESTGTVRVWRKGAMITEIERSQKERVERRE